jgi:hypothetical protein
VISHDGTAIVLGAAQPAVVESTPGRETHGRARALVAEPHDVFGINFV